MNSLLAHKIINSLTDIVRPTEGGLTDTINEQNTMVLDVVKNLGATAITVLLLVLALKAKAAVAAVIGALFVSALLFWGLNGGFMNIGEMLKEQFG